MTNKATEIQTVEKKVMSNIRNKEKFITIHTKEGDMTFNGETIKDLTNIDPRLIYMDYQENERTDYGTEEEILAFRNSIKTNGVMVAVTVYRLNEKDDHKQWVDGYRYHLVHGYRRTTEVKNVINEGSDIKTVPARITKKPTELEILLNHIIQNQGKPLTALEEGRTYNKLIERWGWSVQQVHKEIGKGVAHIYNMIEIYKASHSPAISQALQNNEIKPTALLNLSKAVKDEANRDNIVKQAIAVAKSEGRDRATSSDINNIMNKQKSPEQMRKILNLQLQKTFKTQMESFNYDTTLMIKMLDDCVSKVLDTIV